MNASLTATVAPIEDRSPPGDLAIWIFILAELLAFAALFAAFAIARSRNVALFDAMQLTLDRSIGAANTVFLIAASWCVARAVAAIRRAGRAVAASRWLLGAMFFGSGFVVLKLIEYREKFAAGINLTTNTFYMFYLSLTAFHFMHVLLGMVILAAVWLRTRAGAYTPESHVGLETGASYWHMVDLVWIVLFPLVYVMR